VPLRFATDLPFYSYTFAGAEPPGTWVWYAFLTRAGTDPLQVANWIGFDFAVFTFAP
jgi:hypothetical protein